MLLPLLLWLLGFCSLSAGVPVNSTGTASGNATILSVNIPPAVNKTSEVASGLGVLSNVSGETLEDLQLDNPVDEGDILVSEDRNAVSMLWPNAVVPYAIAPDVAHRKAAIEKAFRMITSFTCIRFKERTQELDYINIMMSSGCASYIGCRGGPQPVYFADSCSTGNLCHELIHALGMYHEHTRRDRDGYVSVQWSHIATGKKINFQVKQGDTLNLPYDFESIMHYGTSYFSADGSPTIVSKDSDKIIGQRSHLSKLDIQKLNALYKCEKSKKV